MVVVNTFLKILNSLYKRSDKALNFFLQPEQTHQTLMQIATISLSNFFKMLTQNQAKGFQISQSRVFDTLAENFK
ncbi:hypothetical protein BpHYR1_003336 [Brachionus plicatilis]|uniref:Uncharacterized protein n=1 Tax=Brachionus plicatilis TaxID=10195 RepID=A0A3M7R910_BRAPC|nr:hypothetical protein BpHYR1_003336 [Brachionus plicatilis]